MSEQTGVAVRPAKGGVVEHIENFVESWGRLMLSAGAILLQLAAFVALVVLVAQVSAYILIVAVVLSAATLVVLLNNRFPMPYKLAWTIPVLAIPLLGPLFYLLFASHPTRLRWGRLAENIRLRARAALPSVEVAETPLDPRIARQVAYLRTSGYVPREHTRTHYYGEGAQGFEAMLAAIGRAETYVFCEFFIVASGEMFERLFAALAERAAAGCDVRLMYDDLGSLFRRPWRLQARCAEAGIQVHPVNPLGLGLTLRYNNRDHRKICVIDGTVAFTGGINIADEYINAIERFGHWKDNVLELRGPGAWSMTVMFCEIWSRVVKEEVDYDALVPPPGRTDGEGLVLPFDDTPNDDVTLGLATYRNLMAAARGTVDIVSPYLVIEDDLASTIVQTAESGIRVRIVLPGIPDKWAVNQVARSYYGMLVKHGVEVYEYSPGFVHSKIVLVDDDLASVGTINFDYRSFYLHQENAVWMWQADCLPDVRDDVAGMIAQSRRVADADVAAVSMPTRVLRAVLRTFAPLM